MLIGSVGLEGMELHTRIAPDRLLVGQAVPGQGIMTSVVKADCRHAFSNLAWRKLRQRLLFDQASAGLEKCGFEQEGYCKRHFVKDGQFIDAKVYGLMR